MHVHAASVPAQGRALAAAPTKARRAMVSAWAGFYVDMVDVYLPVIALAPALIYFQPPGLSQTQASALFFATFAATLLGRPVGAVLFGHFADTMGRRRLALISIAGFSICTLAIGLLPGHAAWGLAAPVALIVLRFIDGIFLGGEYTAATPLAFEYCPQAARGLYGGLLLGAYAVAYITISALVLGLLQVIPAGDTDSAYVQWGWRLPFFFGAVLGVIFLVFRARMPESELWQRAPRVRRPLFLLLRGDQRADFWQVLALMTGMWLVSTSVVSVLPRLLLTDVGMSPTSMTATLLVAHVAVFLGFLGTGLVGQRIGRRALLIRGAAVAGTAGLLLYAWLASLTSPGWPAVVLAVATQVTVLSTWGVVIPYCNERFPTSVRASGFGIGYSASIVVAGFYAAYMAALDAVMPYRYTQLVLLAVGAALAVAAARRGPETSMVDLATGAPVAVPPGGRR